MIELLLKFIRKRRLFLSAILAYAGISFIGACVSISVLGETESRQEALVFFFLCEIPALLFVIPLLPINWMGFEDRSIILEQFMSTPENLIRIAAGRLRPPLLMAIILCLIPGLLVLFLQGEGNGIPIIDIVRTTLVVLSIALFVLLIGFYASIICRNAISAAGFSLLIVVLICTEPLWFGPVINSVPDVSALIQFSLLINPFVNVASVLHFDILRTDPFYQICPIGQLRFHYPSYWSAALFNLLMALMIFWRSVIGLRRKIAPSP